MYVKPRSYLTAGIAALGVGAIALSPVQPITAQTALAPQRVVSDLGVALAAAVDPIQAWVNTFETTIANIGILGEFYMQNPFPLLGTIAANTAVYAQEAADGNAGVIPEQIWGNIQTFFQAPWSPGTQLTFKVGPDQTEVSFPALPADYISDTITAVVDPGTGELDRANPPAALYEALVQLAVFQSFGDACSVDGDCLLEQLAPLLNFTNTAFSGQLLGLLGPVLSPLVQLVDSFTAVGQYFQEGEVMDAVYELINIPANMTNAFLNGGNYLDLTGIVNSIVNLPDDFADTTFGIRLGGLLNAMPQNGSLFEPSDNPPTEYSFGVAFDSLAVDPQLPLITPFLQPGIPNGWFGSTIGLGQYLAEQMLVTPVPPAQAAPPAAAEPGAAKQAAALDIPAPALTEAPAEESAPPVAEEEADASATAIEDVADVEAAVEAEAAVSKPAASEPAESAAAGDSGPEAATDSDQSDDNTGRSAGRTQRDAG